MDRTLGTSDNKVAPTCTLFISSGNNVVPVQDLARRVLSINLEPNCENPATRKFSEDPLSIVRNAREFYVSQALTILRAWKVVNMPMANVKPLANFTEWSMVRHALIWLGQPDPATNVFNYLEKDPDRELLGRLLHAWYDCFLSKPTMIREASHKADHELHEVFRDITGDSSNINHKSLGKWISRHAGRIVDNLKFTKDSSTRSAEAWRVLSVQSATDDSI